jgi:hypothetical protein
VKKSARQEKLIISYLLGQATEEERDRIENHYFRDPAYHDWMLALEEELICNYVRGALSAGERTHFETHFLASDRRRRKYELTRELVEYFSEAYAPAPALTFRASRLSRLFRDNSGWVNERMAWKMAMVVLFTLFASTLIFSLQSIYHQAEDQQQAQSARGLPSSEQQRAEQSPAPPAAEPVPTSLPLGAIPNDSRKPVAARTAKPPAESKRIKPAFAPVFVINLPGTRGDDELTEIPVPPNVAAIDLHLPLSEARYSSHEAIVKTLDGDVVWRKANLKPRLMQSGQMVVLSIPTKLLEERDYVINLCCVKERGETRLISESFFSIKRQP